jgi:hypothetical protein
MNTRRNLAVKTLALSALLTLSATPFATQAADADRAVNACVKAFVDRYLPDRTVTVRKQLPAAGPLDVLVREPQYTVAIEARGKQSGELLAQASCVASRRGDVVVLENPASAEFAAKADFTATLLR